ncbi:unnamed protein product [Taenia asiatica]|uniref:Uncharacterized protein n=1 Tax=Taenia asiatica TaxID=60517 RepID=A0A0R3W7B5_TAEAS|nr:unnamed protein product [Taenia asiatica]
MEPWRYSPRRIIFDRPPPMFTYRQPGPLGMPMAPPNFLLPPPPSPILSPILDTASSVVSAWEAEFDPTLKQRREKLDAKRRISVVDFKKKLIRWKELLENPGSASAKEELECLEQECTDPDLLQIMKRKLRRSRRRKRSCQDMPVVVPTGVGEILSRISVTDASEPSLQPPSSVPLRRTENTDTLPFTKYLAGLKNASAFCQEKLRILNKLKRLREARVGQLRNQGSLIPEQLDQAFEEKMHSIKSEIESMQKVINKLKRRLESVKQASVQETNQPVMSIDDAVTPSGLPESVHYLIFGSQNADTNVRWNKFFCQANLNFSDFLRIRLRWDEYLVSSDFVESQDVVDPSRHPPSLLPTTWELPPP